MNEASKALLGPRRLQRLFDCPLRVQNSELHRNGIAGSSPGRIKLHGPFEAGWIGCPHDMILDAFVLHGGATSEQRVHGYPCQFIVVLIGDADGETPISIPILCKFSSNSGCVGGCILQRVEALAVVIPVFTVAACDVKKIAAHLMTGVAGLSLH